MSPYCHEVRGSMELTELVSYVDGYLRVLEVPDAPHAINGLQVANAGTVSRLAAAVDLCEATVRIGRWGETDVSRDALERQLAALTSSAPRLMAFGPERVRRVGIVTGAAGSMIGQAAAAGLDTFITGEGPHHTFFDAEELKLNVFYAGHYAPETVGVKALAEHLHVRFHLPWTFLDHPTGL